MQSEEQSNQNPPSLQNSNFVNMSSPFELSLTPDQFIILQTSLPKGFALMQKKEPGSKRAGGRHKHHRSRDLYESPPVHPRQVSQISQPSYHSQLNQNELSSQEPSEFRTKRTKVKKSDRFLEQDSIVRNQRRETDKTNTSLLSEEVGDCMRILTHLKKNINSPPFIQRVDPEVTGATNYFEIVQDPMDLSTVQRKLKNNEYTSTDQFHSDLKKIFNNSYLYNDKGSQMYKITEDFERFYRKLVNQQSKNAVGWGYGRQEKQKKEKGANNKPGRPRIKHASSDSANTYRKSKSKGYQTPAQTQKKQEVFNRITRLSEDGAAYFLGALQDNSLVSLQESDRVEWNLIDSADQATLKQIEKILLKAQKNYAQGKEGNIFTVEERPSTKRVEDKAPFKKEMVQQEMLEEDLFQQDLGNNQPEANNNDPFFSDENFDRNRENDSGLDNFE